MFTQLLSELYYMTEAVDYRLIKLCSFAYLAFGVLVVILLLYGITAPYGRYARAGWGCYINGKLAWFVQEIPSFVVPLLILFYSNCTKLDRWSNRILIGLFLIHYLQRAIIFPIMIRGGKPTPFIPFIMAFMFCLVNGYIQVGYLANHGDFGASWYLAGNFYAGILLFAFGLLVNIHSDHILRTLRKPSETGYKIPYGGMFEYVSGANFFGEIIEWLGFAVAGCSLPSFAFFFFTLCNIGPRAYQHHRYYLEKFEDYPRHRKALIPFLF
ncbi:hypothetical protein ACJMK2_035971 [Sinanodonta woodiana]|uniref:3-oxo-5alpha-steroid 4-dehydrogenase (NADP(+)) n=1 Tax=Sinanodonta woodiana TaxID=1069815 RepID=A0ABD3WJT9_SINWO